jgi:hypothetical protein
VAEAESNEVVEGPSLGVVKDSTLDVVVDIDACIFIQRMSIR